MNHALESAWLRDHGLHSVPYVLAREDVQLHFGDLFPCVPHLVSDHLT
jgi:hypothetical protein